MADVGKANLFRKLTSRGPSRKHSQSKERSSLRKGPHVPLQEAPERLPLSALQGRTPPPPLLDLSQDYTVPTDTSALPSGSTQPKPVTVFVGTQEVPLSVLLLGVGSLLVVFVLWQAFIASSDTIIRLVVMGIVGTSALLLSPLKDQLQTSTT